MRYLNLLHLYKIKFSNKITLKITLNINQIQIFKNPHSGLHRIFRSLLIIPLLKPSLVKTFSVLLLKKYGMGYAACYIQINSIVIVSDFLGSISI